MLGRSPGTRHQGMRGLGGVLPLCMGMPRWLSDGSWGGVLLGDVLVGATLYKFFAATVSCGGAIEKWAWWVGATGHCLCFESQMCINGKFGERIDSVTIGWRCVVDVELYRERRSLQRHW